MRREHIVGQHFPVGQRQDAQPRRGKKTELGAPPLEAATVGLDQQPGSLVVCRSLNEGQRRSAAMQLTPVHLRAPGIGKDGP